VKQLKDKITDAQRKAPSAMCTSSETI